MKKYFIVAILALVSPSFVIAEGIPAFPMAFYGTVTIDGVVAPVGSSVRVYTGTELAGEVVLQEAGVYGYNNPTLQKLLVKEVTGELVFKIQTLTVNGGVETGGLTPVTYSGFVSGETVQKDLLFTTNTNTNGIVSSGGGGSSKRKVSEPVQPAVIVLGVSTSTNEVEAKIALQKQIISLLTQLIKLLKLQLVTI
jgi:hypothetical protein